MTEKKVLFMYAEAVNICKKEKQRYSDAFEKRGEIYHKSNEHIEGVRRFNLAADFIKRLSL